jgi:hypothetical protein
MKLRRRVPDYATPDWVHSLQEGAGPRFVLTQIYGPIIFFLKVDRGRIQTFSKEGANRGTQTQIVRRF